MNSVSRPRKGGNARLLLFLALAAGGLCGLWGSGRARADQTACPAHVSQGAPREFEGIDVAVHIYLKPLPDAMPGAAADTPALVALGRKLYFERGISLTKTQACNDCHLLDRHQAGVDYKPTSPGAKGTFGTRNAPTVLNAGFEIVQFWDGRAADLVGQAKGPILNPKEMAMRTPEEVVARLMEREDYRRDFARAFPGQAQPLTYDNLARAVAAFERTLVSPSRLDRYLKGESSALSAPEERGLHIFVGVGCVECHNGSPVGGRLLQKFGVYHPYPNQKDLGRFEVTRRAQDRMVFKVPMLRNVTLTPPYFHDGKVATLPEAVRLMGRMQLNKTLTPPQIADIICFLHALEGERPASLDGQ